MVCVPCVVCGGSAGQALHSGHHEGVQGVVILCDLKRVDGNNPMKYNVVENNLSIVVSVHKMPLPSPPLPSPSLSPLPECRECQA